MTGSVSVRKGTIFFGHGRDETAEDRIKQRGHSLTGGFCTLDPYEPSEWFVFPDNIALSIATMKRFEHNLKVQALAMEHVMRKYEDRPGDGKSRKLPLNRYIKEMQEAADAIGRTEKFAIGEGVAESEFVRDVNNTVLHEVVIHLLGRERHHYFPLSINMSESPLGADVVGSLIDKYGI